MGIAGRAAIVVSTRGWTACRDTLTARTRVCLGAARVEAPAARRRECHRSEYRPPDPLAPVRRAPNRRPTSHRVCTVPLLARSPRRPRGALARRADVGGL